MSKRRTLPRVAVATGAALLLLLAPTNAHADTSEKVDGAFSALKPCIDRAIAEKAELWLCTPEGLQTYTSGADSSVKTTTTSIAPAIAEQRQSPASTGRAPEQNFDTWCETGSICRNVVSDFVEQTKGNAAWGDQSGARGSFDVGIRTNLNGRQAQWTVTLIHDTGPSIQFHDVRVACREDNVGSDGDCGVHNAGSPFVSSSWRSSTLYGNRLNNANDYFGEGRYAFTPVGFRRLTGGNLQTTRFDCPTQNRNCTF